MEFALVSNAGLSFKGVNSAQRFLKKAYLESIPIPARSLLTAMGTPIVPAGPDNGAVRADLVSATNNDILLSAKYLYVTVKKVLVSSPNLCQLKMEIYATYNYSPFRQLKALFGNNVNFDVNLELEINGQVWSWSEEGLDLTTSAILNADQWVNNNCRLQLVRDMNLGEQENASVIQALFPDRPNEFKAVNGRISIVAKASRHEFEQQHNGRIRQSVELQQLAWLRNQSIFGRDSTIIAFNGKRLGVIRCYRAVLKAYSKVFQLMFELDMTEKKTGVCEEPDFSKDCMQALVDFLERRDIHDILSSSSLAVELMEAAHAYNIKILYDAVRELILLQVDESFDIAAALNLYSFAKLMQDQEKDIRNDLLLDKGARIIIGFVAQRPGLSELIAKTLRRNWRTGVGQLFSH